MAYAEIQELGMCTLAPGWPSTCLSLNLHQLFLGIHQHITRHAYAKAAQPLAHNSYFSQTSTEPLQHAGLGKEGQSDPEDIQCFTQVHSFI